MPSERVQRQIDRLLDQAEQATAGRDWHAVLELVRGALALDSENADALSFGNMAKQAIGNDSISSVDPVTATAPETGVTVTDSPPSFASGRYTVSKFLGEGGKKKVYLAHDNTLDRNVAFALIKTEGLDETSRERVKREAQAMGRMGTHPCIMPIYDLGEEPDANGVAQPFMVQPLMGGGDVEGLIEDAEGPLPLEDALRIATQTAQGLVFAHSKGIVHRDLKPGNVWLDEDGAAKIGDFGLAVATDRSRLTVEKVMVGTVNYMPPEQATGGEVTPRADFYSLGAMLYEMCTGRVPFMGDDEIAVISQHINTPPVAPGWHNSSIPKTLDSLILRLLAKDPTERPESAEEVLDALESVDLSAAPDNSEEDEARLLDSMAGGVFVGRHQEMDSLKAAFEEVLSGKGRMVTLVGEPGIGKTRTAQELATYAAMRGAEVVWGRSYESGGAPPYWPWVQAIRSHVSATEPEALRNQLGSTAPVVAEVVPDFREKLPDIPEPAKIEDPESARFRLFDSISTFLKNVSGNQPLVVMLEDLHWADKPSLMLLEFVARELANARIMIVGNYRDMELNRRHPLSVTLGDLSRERLFDRVVLRGLQKHDVERFIEIAAGINPPPALVDTVHNQTEGNPLFVTETVRLLIQEGDITSGKSTKGGTTSWEIRIPEGVREVIGRRLDRLSERCNELLTIAAVIGRQFRFDVLKMLAEDTTEGQLLDAMDEALNARIIEELPGEVGFYQFTHAQMQETLTLELSANRLVRMHARIAEALEEYYGEKSEEHADELAEHFVESETVLGSERLVRYSLLAGERALEAFGHEEALAYFERVVNSVGKNAATTDAGEAWLGIGRCQLATLEREHMSTAVVSLRRAFDIFIQLGMTETALSATRPEIPAVTGIVGVVGLLKSAIGLVSSDSAEYGRLLARLGQFQQEEEFDGQLGIQTLREALRIAQKTNNRDLELTVLVNLISIESFQIVDSSVHIERLTKLARNSTDSALAMRGLWYVATYNHVCGDAEAARQFANEAAEHAEKTRGRFWLGDDKYLNMILYSSQGDWSKAREAGNRMLEIQPNHPRNLSARAIIEYEKGEFAEGDRFASRIFDLFGMTGLLSNLLEGLAARLPDFTLFVPLDKPLSESYVRTLSGPGAFPVYTRATRAILATKAFYEGDRETGEMQHEYFTKTPSPYRFLIASHSTTSESRLLGLAAAATGRYDESPGHFDAALEHCRSAGYRPELAWTCSQYSDMLLDRNAPGDRQKAIELQDEAISIATELGMKPLLERVLAKREILKA